ncbi:MAG: type II toxin-antitoxin system Phd/YefM family antitoxin [Planctomycetota bacterium]
MVSQPHPQSLDEFRRDAEQVLDRLNAGGGPESLTQDGETRAVLLSPADYQRLLDDAEFAQTMAAIKQSQSELAAGQGRPADVAFAETRERLEAELARRDPASS